MQLKNLYESQQLDREVINQLCSSADDIRQHPSDYRTSLNGIVLATLFYEPSTRTRLSFEAAMLKLGGNKITTENAAEFSSAVKGESLEDTIRVVSKYADCIVLRHKTEGMAQRAAELSTVPVINAGDGKGQHPTQALTDVYTIQREVGRLDNLTVAMVGDLAYGRTVRSLSYLLAKFRENKLIFVSPPHLRVGEDIKEYLEKHSTKFAEQTDLDEIFSLADIIYMTRVQKERMLPGEYEAARGKLAITEGNLPQVRDAARILHPLPHNEEINLSVETEQKDARVAYFRQAENGLYIRMALLLHLLK